MVASTLFTVLFAVAAIIGVLTGVIAAFRWRDTVDGTDSRDLWLATAVPIVVGLGYASAAAGVDRLPPTGSPEIHVGIAIGWLLATVLALTVLVSLVHGGLGMLGAVVVLDVVGVGLMLAGDAATAGLITVGDRDPTLVGAGIWAAGALAVLLLVVALLRPVSRRASALPTDRAAFFSVLRNLLAGGMMFTAAARGVDVVLGLESVGAAALLVVELVVAVGFVAVVTGQPALLASE